LTLAVSLVRQRAKSLTAIELANLALPTCLA